MASTENMQIDIRHKQHINTVLYFFHNIHTTNKDKIKISQNTIICRKTLTPPTPTTILWYEGYHPSLTQVSFNWTGFDATCYWVNSVPIYIFLINILNVSLKWKWIHLLHIRVVAKYFRDRYIKPGKVKTKIICTRFLFLFIFSVWQSAWVTLTSSNFTVLSGGHVLFPRCH